MSKHTPGPWRISHHSETSVAASNDRGIATAGGYQTNMIDPDVLWEENVANARLIAAAPELLSALKAIVVDHLHTTFPPYAPGESPYDKGRAAIAKAESA